MTTVMVDGRYLGPQMSGIGRYCHETVSRVQQLDPSLDFRFVVRRRGDEAPLRASGSFVFDAAPYGPRTSLWLGRRLGPRPADLFHSPFHVLPRGLACPSVLTMHDAFNFTQPETSNYRFPISWAEWAYFLAAIPDSLRRARRVVCVTQATADAVARFEPWCRPKLRVIHHGVAEKFQVIADRERVARDCERLVGGAEPFWLCVGGLSPNKNHARIVEAFARARGGRSADKLVVVSRLGKPEALLARARELGVERRLVLLPRPTDDDLLALYNGARGLLLFSVVEGFGLPLIEAMACGCPVLTSSRSCMPEVVGDAALLADPFSVGDMARQIEKAADEPGLRDDLRGRGLERARRFTWQRAAELHLDVYREALAAG